MKSKSLQAASFPFVLLFACSSVDSGAPGEEEVATDNAALTGGAGPENTGVLIASTFPSAEGSFSFVFADFANDGIEGKWTEVKFGDCELRRYKDPTPTREGTPVSAGTLSVTGGLSPVTLTPGPTNTYEPFFAPFPIWNGGESLRFAGSGTAQVPRFSVRITAPSAVTFLRPNPAQFLAANPPPAVFETIARFEDYPVRWVPAPFGTVQVSLVPKVEAPDGAFVRAQINITCEYPAGRGSGMIPAELLSQLPKGEMNLGLSNISQKNRRRADRRLVTQAAMGGTSLPVLVD